MNRSINLITIFALFVLAIDAKSADKIGNGGGMICVGGKCITLAEAGFKPVAVEASLEICDDALTELNKIVELLPRLPQPHNAESIISPLNVSEIIGNLGDIQFVKSANPDMVRKFLRRYSEVLKNSNASGFQKNLEIAGFTVPDSEFSNHRTTYLIIDKFNQLSSPRSKALLLIHEYSLRVNGKTLEDALTFDAAIVDYLKARETNSWQDFDHWRFLKVTFDKWISEPYILGDLLHRIGSLPALAFFTSYKSYYDAILELDYAKLLANRKYDPRISRYMSPGKFQLEEKTRGSFISDYVYLKTSGYGEITFTNEDFEMFVAQYLVQNPNKQELARVLSQCKGAEDDTAMLYGEAEGTEPRFYRAASASCGLNECYGPSGLTTLRVLAPYLNGLSLRIPGKLVCLYTPENLMSGPECRLEN